MNDRDTALINIRAALSIITKLIQQKTPGTRLQDAHEQSDTLRLIVASGQPLRLNTLSKVEELIEQNKLFFKVDLFSQ